MHVECHRYHACGSDAPDALGADVMKRGFVVQREMTGVPSAEIHDIRGPDYGPIVAETNG